MISHFKSNLIKSWPKYILITTCIILSFYEYKVSNIGFDLSDEGWSLSKFRFPQEVKATISRDHLYSSILFEFLGYDVSKLRKANLLLLIFSSYILASGLHAFVVKEFKKVLAGNISKVCFFSFILICQLPSLWIERIPAYNNIASFISLCSFGFLLRWHTKENKPYHLLILIGIMIGMSIIIRLPSGVTSMAIVTFILIISKDSKLYNFAFYLIGISLTHLFHFIFIEKPISFYETSKNGFLFHSSLNSPNYFIIERYFNEIWGNVKFVLIANRYELFFFAVALTVLIKKNKIRISKALFLVSFLYISFKHFKFGDLEGGLGLYWRIWRFYIAQFVIMFISIITFASVYKINFKNLITKSTTWISLIFLTSPVLFAFGTSNLITFNMNFYTSFFFIGIILVILALSLQTRKIASSFHLHLLLLLFSIGPSYAYIQGRFSSNLYTISETSGGKIFNNTELLVSSNSRLRVTSATKSATETLCEELKKHKKDLNYLLNFSTMPGLNYLCDLPHPIQPWTVHMKQNRNFTLENINRNQFNNSAILYRSKDLEILEQLQKFFPNWKSTHDNSRDIVYYINDKKVSLTLHIPKDE